MCLWAEFIIVRQPNNLHHIEHTHTSIHRYNIEVLITDYHTVAGESISHDGRLFKVQFTSKSPAVPFGGVYHYAGSLLSYLILQQLTVNERMKKSKLDPNCCELLVDGLVDGLVVYRWFVGRGVIGGDLYLHFL